MSQKEQILLYIKTFGSISPMDAFADLGITKLATRVSEMRRDGIKFNIEMVNGFNRFEKPIRYARYSLVEGSNG